MKTAKLIIGIISIVLALVVMLQSCAASIGDALANQGGTSGGAGIFVALFMFIAGIVAIATRKSKAGGIVCMIFYALAGLIGLTAHGIYADLIVWGIICLIFAVVFLIATITFKKQNTAGSPSV
jgi:hypothetical protein